MEDRSNISGSTSRLPDEIRLKTATLERPAPEVGPRLLFFSGGTALTAISRGLKAHTHNSIHLVTPFDSGGSSAKLRQAFNMPAVGDLRSRLMALADESLSGHPQIYRLFTTRLPQAASQDDLERELTALTQGRHALTANLCARVRGIVLAHLKVFSQSKPADFDLRGASLGNLILAGGYLSNGRQLDPIVQQFSDLVRVRGTVRTVVTDNLHVAADLQDGTTIVGQHRLTGKEQPGISSPIRSFYLNAAPNHSRPATSRLSDDRIKLITSADLICFAPGSFYSSLIANLLPEGVTDAIVQADCPKVFLPSLGNDPEQFGMSLEESVTVLLDTLRWGGASDIPKARLLNVVLLDHSHALDPGGNTGAALRRKGMHLHQATLVRPGEQGRYDPESVASALLSFV
ncbi:MAG: GAK system CofD-like protein [Pseudomonadota bacterium]